VDPDGALRRAVSDPVTVSAPVVVEEPPPDAPAFVPPAAAKRRPVPDFIPPGTKRWGF
jgi:sec-independent protein translocase protein TatB